MTRTILFGTFVLAAVSLTFYGCGSPADDAKQNSSADGKAGSGENPEDSHGGHDGHGDHGNLGDHSQTDMEKMKTELAKFSPEDRASAEKQHICPVTGEMLGTMGAPKKVDVNGQQVWICCDGCKDKLLKNPDEYLAKLKSE